MVDLRKWIPVLALVAVLLGSASFASAQALSGYSCVATAVNTTVRSEGLAELVGDILLTCNGPAAPGGVLPVNFRLTGVNTNITSRILSTDTNQSEALLLVNDPSNNAGKPAGLPALANNGNAYLGVQSFPNIIDWNGVAFPAGGTTTTVRITNVRVNASVFGQSMSTPVQMFVSTTPSQSVSVTSPLVTVALAQPGLASVTLGDTNLALLQCNSQNASTSAGTVDNPATISFKEGFGTAFKPAIAGAESAVSQSPESVPGFLYNSESGFLSAALGSKVGLASNGTRLIARFTNIPSGATVYVSTTATAGGVVANLVPDADANGAGGTVGAGTGNAFGNAYRAVTVSGTTGTATWEVVSQSATSYSTIDTLKFNVIVGYTAGSNTPGLGNIGVAGNLAPISTVATASSTAPVPRFTDVSKSANIFGIVPCVTNLLFPFVTNTAGFDTGIAISNTTLDIFGTAAQEGACSLNYFSDLQATTQAPAAQTSSTIRRGAQLVFTLSAGNTSQGINATPGFQGYMIAQCKFQYAHGFAFVTKVGATDLAMGYLALVMDTGSQLKRGPNGVPQAGEYLAQ